MVSTYVTLLGLAFSASLGLLFLVIGCAQFDSYWPFFNVIFYLCAPIPYMIGSRNTSEEETSPAREWGYFFVTGFVLSAFGLPIVFLRLKMIESAACGLVCVGNLFSFFTIWAYLKAFHGKEYWDMDDD